jgi:hypothetical protein
MQALVFALILCGILAVSMVLVFRARLARMSAARRGEGFEEFSSQLAGLDLPSSIQRSVFDFLRKRVRVPDFPVRPADELGRVYGIVEDDVYDAAREIAEGCGKMLPERSDENVRSIRTVTDLVRYVARRANAESGR